MWCTKASFGTPIWLNLENIEVDAVESHINGGCTITIHGQKYTIREGAREILERMGKKYVGY